MSIKTVRNIIISSFFLFAGLIATPAHSEEAVSQVSVSQTNNQVILHTVAKGETVYSIAKAYNIPVESIYQSNPGASSGIRVGQSMSIPKQSTSATAKTIRVYNYTVQPKETLYSISKQNGVTVDDLVNLNPELKTKPLTEGQIIKVPASVATSTTSATTKKAVRFIEHNVQPKETIYGISKQYKTTPESLIAFNPELKNSLKEGSTILVPITQDSLISQTSLLDVEGTKVGIVLPFVNKSQGQGARFLEYYEGMLLALDEMKARGFSANVFVFDMGSDTGTTKLKSLLETTELQNLDLLIGGVSAEQVGILSSFSQRYGIKYVIPFPTNSNAINTNPLAFQINEDQTSLIASVSKAFVNRFTNSNIIFITSQEDKVGFVKGITAQLSSTGVVSKSVVADNNISENLSSALDLKRRNVIVVASGSESVLQKVLPALSTIKTQQPLANITLFGQPEWQTYTKYVAEYGKYDTYIYTSFFLNENDTDTKQFITNYKNWYNNKSMINTYPKYAALGYDTGSFFFGALMKYGKNFENSLSINTTPTLQTPFSFKRISATGGYLNTGFYFIHYGVEGYIQKIAYAQW